MKKFRSIYLIPIFLIFILIIMIYFVYDYNHTKETSQKQTKEEKNYENELPEELKSNIPDKGEIIFIELFTDENKNKDILPLIKQEKFRKSLYYAINRTKIAEKNSNLKPLSVLFTKAFFQGQDNKKYFPKPFLPHNEDSMNIYKDLDLKNYGFNETKALQYLEEAWNDLNDEDKNKNYTLKLKINDTKRTSLSSQLKEIDNSDVIQNEIIEQIQYLFKRFTEKQKIELNKLNISKIDSSDNSYDLMLTKIDNVLYNNEIYMLFLNNPVVFQRQKNDLIEINLKPIKQYLESQKQLGFEVENNLLNQLSNEGICKFELGQFEEFFKKNILPLFTSLNNSTSYQQESEEIKSLKQKTFEEIFEKVLCLLHRQMLNIPVCVNNIESTN